MFCKSRPLLPTSSPRAISNKCYSHIFRNHNFSLSLKNVMAVIYIGETLIAIMAVTNGCVASSSALFFLSIFAEMLQGILSFLRTAEIRPQLHFVRNLQFPPHFIMILVVANAFSCKSGCT